MIRSWAEDKEEEKRQETSELDRSKVTLSVVYKEQDSKRWSIVKRELQAEQRGWGDEVRRYTKTYRQGQ